MSGAGTTVLHLISEADLATADATGVIAPDSLRTEGFVHCCTDQQVTGVISRFYAGRSDLWVLTLDAEALGDAELRWEAPAHPDGSPNNEAEAADRFPHVYGPIATDAVVDRRRIT